MWTHLYRRAQGNAGAAGSAHRRVRTLASGRRRVVPVDVGEMTISLEGKQFHSSVIFAEEGEPSLLGMVSLEEARLAVDLISGRLIPTDLVWY